MFRNAFKNFGLMFVFILLTSFVLFAQKDSMVPDLSKIITGEGWKIFNRAVTALSEDNKNGSSPNAGRAYYI